MPLERSCDDSSLGNNADNGGVCVWVCVCRYIDRVIVDVLSELVTSNRDLNEIMESVLQISGGKASKAKETASAKVLWWE